MRHYQLYRFFSPPIFKRYILSLLILIGFFFSFKTISKNVDSSNAYTSSIQNSSTCTKGVSLCIKDLFNVNQYDFTKWGTQFSEKHELFETSSGCACQLLYFSEPLIVKCLDIALNHKQNLSSKNNDKLNFLFIGDSRIRQHFLAFVRLFPDYDMISNFNPNDYHNDMEMKSETLQIRVTFKWRPQMDENVTAIIEKLTADATSRPEILMTGMALWHMNFFDNGTLEAYKEKVGKLAPKLDMLGRLTKVIWLIQYPSNDVIDSMHTVMNKFISQKKIIQFNDAAQQIFQYYRHVNLWNSTAILGKEYLRGCKLLTRHGRKNFVSSLYSANCLDYLHPSNIPLFEANQIIFNDFCNRYLN